MRKLKDLSINTNEDKDRSWDIFKEYFLNSQNELIPTIKDKKGKREDQTWFSSAIKAKLKYRESRYRQHKSNPTEINLERLVKSRREVQTMIRVAKRN